ncbi:MAG: CoA transferase [Candidatus Eremiobacteraeota bacterium]|nr:CoA transferase [Candidatus Eremiobacteraeota bacterium]
MKFPLENIRVLDFTRVLAGPFCTMLMGDMGAEIIKIEKPGVGDDARHFGPPFLYPENSENVNEERESAFFLSVNRNKKSITLNLKNPDSKKIVYDLVKKCDVVVENFRPGAMKRLGFDYEKLKELNPGIIYASISGFGQTGRLRETAGYDLLVQGMSGVMSLTGEPDGPPFKAGISIGDLVAGMYAIQGILLALYMREKTGLGQYIDISLLEGLVSLLTFQAGKYFATDENALRKGNQHPNICPYETFPAGDGYFNIAIGNDKLWQRFCDVMGMNELAGDLRFKTNPLRVRNRDELYEILCENFRTKDIDYWIEKLQSNDIPCGRINTVEAILNDPVMIERNMIHSIQHPLAGEIKMIRNAINLSGAADIKKSPPPLQGEHTEEILKDLLLFDDVKLDELRRNGII